MNKPEPTRHTGTFHELKVHPQFWPAVRTGKKPFECRRDDRKYRVGDLVRLREYDPKHGFTSEPTCTFLVTYILAHEDFPNGLQRGYVILGFGDEEGI